MYSMQAIHIVSAATIETQDRDLKTQFCTSVSCLLLLSTLLVLGSKCCFASAILDFFVGKQFIFQARVAIRLSQLKYEHRKCRRQWQMGLEKLKFTQISWDSSGQLCLHILSPHPACKNCCILQGSIDWSLSLVNDFRIDNIFHHFLLKPNASTPCYNNHFTKCVLGSNPNPQCVAHASSFSEAL